MLPQEIIRRKRDGQVLEEAEIGALIAGITDGSVSEGQAAAFAMAVWFNGMSVAERVALTMAMTRSGRVLDWSREGLDGPILDKHSTGGVGDKISLILAPVIAACGAYVPMISGRGLGHTGGTLDKFDSIPGYRSQPDIGRLRATLRKAGCVVVGATEDIAPADRRLYAIRDVTATVESLDLITASILSKKLAAGLDALILDVKFGSGAFMVTPDAAVELAESLTRVGNGAGLQTAALLTDMNQVPGHAAGNAVEMREAIDFLIDWEREPRLEVLAGALCAELLVAGGLAADIPTAQVRVAKVLADGSAAERFGRMVAALGGPTDLLERPDAHLPRAPLRRQIRASRQGAVAAIDVRALGIAIVELGGGRRRPTDDIDHAVGLTDVAGIGRRVGPAGYPLAVLHGREEAHMAAAEARIRAAFTLSDRAVEAPAPVLRRIGP